VGWDNTAYRVNGRYVFRFPRREIAAGLIETEARLLPAVAAGLAVAGGLPLAIPVPLFVGEASEAFGWRFSGYEEIPGRTACGVTWSTAARDAAGPVLGKFLKSLHGFSRSEAKKLGAPFDTLGRLDLEKRIPRTVSQLETLERLGLIASRHVWMEIVEAVEGTEAAGEESLCLAHGDLYARHLLVDDGGRLCGVIDWGDVHLGDVAVDLAIGYAFLPEAGREAFFEAYGAVDEGTRLKARFRALYHSAVTAEYGYKTGDAALLRESLTALAFLRLGSD
jgi:aminoglycoside phosphotransferase (APT) family kinase protein